MKKKCIIFPVSMKNVGLLYHFTELAIAFYDYFKSDQGYDFFIISEGGEQNPGLWDRVYRNIPNNSISIFKSSSDFPDFVESKLKSSDYAKVIYLSQGIMQFIGVINLKRKYKDKLWLYTRLNSFKHGTKYRKPLTFFLSILFKKYANFVNFQCESTVRIFSNANSLFKAGKAGIIPLGLIGEDDIIPEDPELVGVLKDKKTVCVVYLANFHKHKRQLDLIDFMNSFLKADSNINLILLGEGIYLKKCINYAENNGLSEQVYFPGRLDRKYIPFVLRHADLAVVFSKVETFGHNILEPLFYGTPVVSSNVGIASDVIKDYQNGALLFSDSLVEFEKKAQPFLIHGKIHHDSSWKDGIRSSYSWGSIVKQYKSMFETL